MSGVAAPVGGPLPAASRAATRPQVERSSGLELALFVALASFAAAHWALFVTSPPYGRMALVVAVAATGGAGLAMLDRVRARRWLVHAAATLMALVTAGISFVAMGLPARLLMPRGWGELSESLDQGLAGVSTVNWPYGGEDDWVRLAILLGAPLVLSAAAALAFWPARKAHGPLRVGALLLLVALYAIPVTERSLGSSLLRGLVLLVLLAAWLWLPRVGLRRSAPAAAVVLAVGLCSLPVASALDADKAWWDYSGWQWFGTQSGVSFDWNHSYGPLDWSRDGKTLLNVRSRKAHYWKVDTLDRFDGLRWLHSRANEGGRPDDDLPERPDRRWITQTRVTVRSLRTNFVAGPGTIFSVQGTGPYSGSSDGTTSLLDQPLKRGEDYTVLSYAPDPSAREMRAAAGAYPSDLTQYTGLFLPRAGETALSGPGLKSRSAERELAPGDPVTVPLKGEADVREEAAAQRAILASPYARVYRLARSLTDGRPTTYDAVKSVEDHLQSSYTYSEQVPTRAYPLAGFLFKDRRGYCQQFSGAMALMLRMSGIPARVSSGFSPGSYNSDTKEYRVRDLDAHSWVEVYFPRIGWVPFDPTPTAAPAESQSTGSAATSAARGDAGDVSIARNGGASASDRAGESSTGLAKPKAEGGGVPAGMVIVAATALLAAVGGAWWALARRRRARGDDPVEADLRELRDALVRLGWRLPAGTTLLGLEHRLARAAGPSAAGYAASLRSMRYSPEGRGRPSAAHRRALRRELTRGNGLLARVRGLLALPPRRSS